MAVRGMVREKLKHLPESAGYQHKVVYQSR